MTHKEEKVVEQQKEVSVLCRIVPTIYF